MANKAWRTAMVWAMAFYYSLAIAGDPTAPPYARAKQDRGEYSQEKRIKKPKKQSYILRQIVNREKDKSAVINGYVVNEGSFIHNAYVQRIKENSVVLSVNGSRKEILLESELPRIRH